VNGNHNPLLQSNRTCDKIDISLNKEHVLLMSVRQALIIVLGAIEDYLGLSRSIVPNRKR
jgi:hypothetical protein